MTPPNDNARGRDVIEQILVNMRGQTEQLRYSRIVASSYNVHLHADDYARLEGLVPEIITQARRALTEELDRLNRAQPLEQRLRRWVNQPKLPYERAGSEWTIHVFADPNDELEPGDILVDATLVTPAGEDMGGSRTQRIVTRRHGDEVDRRVTLAEPTPVSSAPPTLHATAASSAQATPAAPDAPHASSAAPAADVASPFATTASSASSPSSLAPVAGADGTAIAARDERPALATLRWRDGQGEHEFRMVTPIIKLGRGGPAYWVDVKLETVPDVSREHLRIRFDAGEGRFFIQDLSSFGTTVDGVALPSPPSGETPAGAAPEAPLPDRAIIGLAGRLDVRFEADVDSRAQSTTRAAASGEAAASEAASRAETQAES